jgi:hypothetical protein
MAEPVFGTSSGAAVDEPLASEANAEATPPTRNVLGSIWLWCSRRTWTKSTRTVVLVPKTYGPCR